MASSSLEKAWGWRWRPGRDGLFVGWDRFRVARRRSGRVSEVRIAGLEVLLQELKRLLPDTYCMENEPTTMTNDPGGDASEVARRTIEYLTFHPPIIAVSFPEAPPPSQEMLRLLEPYLENIELEVGETVARYLMQSLAKDWLGLGGIEIE